jgi:hydroxymethylpyrimidine pyrophosphatase-like HAD family hydrolase
VRYLAVVTDYDGVIAHDGHPSNSAIAALGRLRASGRRAVLITGRRLDELIMACPQLDLFDCVVAENGAVIYEPATRTETSLAKPPPPQFVQRLKELRVEPLEVGRVIVATWLPHHTAVVQVIQQMGLELQVVFNRAAVMVLPAGINKATGMDYALRRLGLSRHEVVGIGDSENDHSFLQRSECAATVANAVPSILQAASIVAKASNGDGFAELVDELIANDLLRMQGQLRQHLITIGRREDGSEVTVPPYGFNILIAGPSGTGKSTVAAGIVERLMEQEYQLCIVDPEGDYGTLPNVVTIGNQNHPVTVSEVLALLENPKITLNVNLLGIPLADRPELFGQLFPSLQAIRTRTGRPHWIVLDEAHHMLPADWAHLGRALPQSLGETVLVTVHPDHLSPLVLKLVDVMIAVGPAPQKTIQKFADAIGQSLDWPAGLSFSPSSAVVWFPRKDVPPHSIEIVPGTAERIRHHRKYAEGNMRHRSFFFRGPGDRQNIRAHNLAIFSQIADGVDDETWMYHLRRGDYSRWFRGSVKDSYLADQAEQIERREDLHPAESRRLIRSLIEARYTLPE